MMTDKEFASSLLQMARADLNTSNTIYVAKNYLQSLYSLQQTVEKTNKAIGIWGNHIKANEVKKLGHEQGSIHDNIMDHQISIFAEMQSFDFNLIPLLASIFKEEEVDFGNHIQVCTEIKLIKDELKATHHPDMSEKKMLQALNSLEKIENYIKLEPNEEELKQFPEKFKQLLIESVKKQMAKDPTCDPVEHDKLEAELADLEGILDFLAEGFMTTIQTAVKLTRIFIQLHALGFMLSPIAYQRYPDLKKGLDPLKIYNSEHPIVKHYFRIYAIIDKGLRIITVLQKKESK